MDQRKISLWENCDSRRNSRYLGSDREDVPRMSLLDSIFYTLTDPWKLLIMAGGILAGVIIGYYYQPSPGNQVNFLQPKTRSGYDIDIDQESALVLYFKKLKGFPWKRALKYATGYDIRKGKKVFTRYFVREGSIFTTKAEAPKVEISGSEWLKTVMGEDVYKSMTQEYRDIIESNTVLLSVKISEERPEIKTKDGKDSALSGLTEDDYYDALKEQIPVLFAEGVERSTKNPIWEKIAYLGSGFGICMALWVLKVFVI